MKEIVFVTSNKGKIATAQNDLKNIKVKIYELEMELLKYEVRASAEKISQLLSEDFVEFCSSGSIYHYKAGDIFEVSCNDSEPIGEIRDFEVKELARDCILATYKLIKHSEINENRKYSLRSSIWRNIDGLWKMTFHQGTLILK